MAKKITKEEAKELKILHLKEIVRQLAEENLIMQQRLLNIKAQEIQKKNKEEIEEQRMIVDEIKAKYELAETDKINYDTGEIIENN